MNDGANPHKIGASGGWATNARWSPDGRWLVYVYLKGKTCAFHRLDMRRPLTAEPEAIYTCPAVPGIPLVYSADGSKIFFGIKASMFAPFELYELNLATSSKRRLSQPIPKGRGHYWLDVHPGHGKLLMLTEVATGETAAYELDTTTGEYERLIHWPYKVDTAVWSHRGGTIVHQGRHPSYKLVETNLSSGQTTVLVADSRRMMHPQRIAGSNDYSFSSYIYNRDIALNGAPLAALNSSVMDYLPTLSRDGRKLAFISKRSGESRLFIKDFASNRLIAIDLPQMGRAIYGIDWSFSDDQILLTTSNELMIASVAEEAVTRTLDLSLTAYGSGWSTQNRFTFSSFENGRWQVYEHDLTGNRTEKLNPRWAFVLTSPSGQVIVDQDHEIISRYGDRIDMGCADPVQHYTLTMRLDGDTFYCIDRDNPETLLKRSSDGEVTPLVDSLNRSTRQYSIAGDDVAQAFLHDAVSDIMRTRFPRTD